MSNSETKYELFISIVFYLPGSSSPNEYYDFVACSLTMEQTHDDQKVSDVKAVSCGVKTCINNPRVVL